MLLMTPCRIINMIFLIKGLCKYPARKKWSFKALPAPFQRLVLKRRLGILFRVPYAVSC